jgi:hypothetical protein
LTSWSGGGSGDRTAPTRQHTEKAGDDWLVRVGDELCVRSVNGRTSGWFRGTQLRHEGRLRAGGIEKQVTFADADSALNDAIDAAYRAKYRRYQPRIVDSIVSPLARSATIRLLPR